MKIIGLDVGTKRIGVARADSTTRIAIPSGFLEVDGTEWEKLDKLASLYNTNWFVVGLPRNNQGLETRQSLYARNFAKELMQRIPGAKIRFQDESLTSVEAKERLLAQKRTYEKGEIDSEAAAIILQDFLEKIGSKNSTDTVSTEPATNEKLPSDLENITRVKIPNQLQDTLETTKALTKKETEKIKMSAKKTKHKMKKWPFLVALVVIAIVAVGGAIVVEKIREKRAAERQAEYARQEAEMKAEVFSFTIRPGETIFDIKNNLLKYGYSIEEINTAFAADYDFDFLQERPAGASLEGYLYGETYEFYQGATVKEIITKYLEGMGKVISENNLRSRYAARDLSLFEGITLASIVQKESPAGEQATVAQVFLSRLQNGWKLGSDVTVSYAIDIVDPNRTTYTDNAAALTIDSCYNTRLYTGLPCGPISNPNLPALLAVAEPSNTSYLYFLTGDDGLMYYSYTEAEHNQNAYLHCQDLCNISL